MQTVKTELRVRDPGQAAIRSESGDVVVPAGDGPSEAPLANGRADTGDGSSAAFSVRARREPDRSLAVEWDTKLPLVDGERATILPADGLLTFDGAANAIVPPALRGGRSLVLHWCADVGRRVSYGGRHATLATSAYYVQPRGCITGPSHAIAAAPYALDVPWDDVEIVEHVRPDRDGAKLIIGLATLSFGAFAALIASFSDAHIRGGATTKWAFVGGCVGIGLAFDLPMLKTVFASDRDTIVRHR